jgi:hypothetical protein
MLFLEGDVKFQPRHSTQRVELESWQKIKESLY